MKVLAIGSSLMDFFVGLEKSDQVEISDNKVTLPLGAKLPIDIKSLSLGGNSANVSSALKNLSIDTSLYTYLGNDPLSQHIKSKMEEKEIDLLIEDIGTTKGSVSLIFDFPKDRIIFSHHDVATHGFDESKIKDQPDYIFLSSIGKEWEDAYKKIINYAKTNSIPIAFSPGSQQLKDMDREIFKETVKEAKILMCNMEEAKRINKELTGNVIEEKKDLLISLKGNNFDILSITDGKNGAYAVDKNGNVYWVNSIKADTHEKTGAGDAYAGAFLAGILHGKEIEESMRWGVLNALGEMTQVGAQTGQLTIEGMEKEASSNNDLRVEEI